MNDGFFLLMAHSTVRINVDAYMVKVMTTRESIVEALPNEIFY